MTNQKQGEVQKVVRSVRAVKWIPGMSRCYKDTTYNRTTRKVRYKFERVGVYGQRKGDRKGLPGSYYEIPTAIRAIKRAMKKAGLPVAHLCVFDNTILLYQEFPIQLV